jgi:hypothetical protein
MRKAITIATLCMAACFSTPMFAQDPSKKPTEDLVKAAQDSKSKRKKSSTRVITNKDVKQAKGKLIVLDTPAAKKTEKTEATSSLQKQDATLRGRREAKDRLDSAQKKVDGLQKELDAVEQSYYQENDPNYRDNVIQRRFAQTKRQLDDARQDLANARDALQKLEPPPQSQK